MENNINKANDLIADKNFKEAILVLNELEENIETLKLSGLCYLNLNDYTSAKNKFESVVKFNQDDATSWYYLGICYDNLDELSKAKFAYNEVIKLRDKYTDAYKNLGVIYLKTGETQKAYELAVKGTELFPQDYLFYYFAGSALITLHKFKESLEFFEKALDLNDNNIQIYCNYGVALMSCQDYDLSIKMFMKAVEINPNNPLAYHNLASVYQVKRDLETALKYYRKAYELDNSEVYLSSVALAEFNMKLYEDSKKHYTKLVYEHPEKQNYKYNLSCCYEKLGDLNSAIIIMEQLIVLNPKSKTMLHKLAIMYDNFNKPEKAKMIYETLMSNGFVSDEIYYSYALVCIKTNDIDIAERILKKVIELNPNFARARKDLGIIYLNKRLFDYAKDEFEKAYTIAPKDKNIVFEYANFLQAMQKFEDAKNLYDEAIELDNKNPQIYIFAALNAQLLKDMKIAIKYIEKAVNLIPGDPFILLNAGKIYYAAHKYSKAQFVLIKSWEINQNVEVENLIGLTYLKLKEYEKAYNVFEKLSKEYSTNININMSHAISCEKTERYDEAKIAAQKVLNVFDDMPEALKLMKRIKKIEKQNSK